MWEVNVTEMTEGELRETLPETSWAWLAGFLDGEGFFDIKRGYTKRPARTYKRGPYKNSKPGWTHFTPRIVLCNTHLPSMEKAAVMLQANINRRKPQAHSRLEMYAIEVSARKKLAHILPNLLPHLTVKKAEAELVYELVCLERGNDPRKERLHAEMAILSQARPGTTKV